MKSPFLATMLVAIFAASLYSQSGSINNTLSSGGSFNIKDGSATFLSLSQTTGYLSLNKSITLPVTTGSTIGVVFKAGNRFIHDYPGSSGYNTFVGVSAGNFTMSGAVFNTAVGYSSLTSLTSGFSNSAFGYFALNVQADGYNNSAFGYNALSHNTSGRYNAAFGDDALGANVSGTYNVAFGSSALGNSTGGNHNSAFGDYVLQNDTSGTYNSAFGFFAGLSLTSGTNNTLLGYNAQPSLPTASNEVVLGNSGVTTLRCNTSTISSVSDARDKRDIRDLPLGLDFLMTVKPRLFNWDRREWYRNGKPDGSKMQDKPTAGFIAQELDEAQTKAQAEWLNLVLKLNPDRLEATPGNLLPIMVKAIQELKTENDALRNDVVMLRGSIAKQVEKEVRAALLKAVQPEDKTARTSLNEKSN